MSVDVEDVQNDAIEKPPSNLSTADLNGKVPRNFKDYLAVHQELRKTEGLMPLKTEVPELIHRKIRAEAARYQMSVRVFSAWVLCLAAEGFED